MNELLRPLRWLINAFVLRGLRDRIAWQKEMDEMRGRLSRIADLYPASKPSAKK